jgi:hypothetical protein
MTNQMATIDATLIVTEIVGMWTEGDAGTGRAIIQGHFASELGAGAMSTDLAPPRPYGPFERPPLSDAPGRFVGLVLLAKARSSTLESRVEVGQHLAGGGVPQTVGPE